jgi:hypothetical protein
VPLLNDRFGAEPARLRSSTRFLLHPEHPTLAGTVERRFEPTGDILLLAYKEEVANCGGLLSSFAMAASKD